MDAELEEFAERMAELLEEQKANIERVGWAAVGVFPTTHDPPETPHFTYSVGFHETLDLPEVIVFGLGAETGHSLLADVYERGKAGETFEPGVRYDGFLVDYPVEFREVAAPRRPLNMARAHYRPDDFPAMQLCWPDKAGRFPWEDGYDLPPHVQPLASGEWE
jgi:hypothetical protein